MDATVDGTTKKNALFSYKDIKPTASQYILGGTRSYSPYGVQRRQRARRHEQLRVLKEALDMLHPG